jgi:hypothetical protein
MRLTQPNAIINNMIFEEVVYAQFWLFEDLCQNVRLQFHSKLNLAMVRRTGHLFSV